METSKSYTQRSNIITVLADLNSYNSLTKINDAYLDERHCIFYKRGSKTISDYNPYSMYIVY